MKNRRKFLSTLSLRRATKNFPALLGISQFLSTLSLRRATAVTTLEGGSDRDFYPRSPCGERLVDTFKLTNLVLFLSTLSLRRATPRVIREPATRRFLSTLSLRRATVSTTIITICTALFLSTLSLRRATFMHRKGRTVILYFYPRSPCGERRPTSVTPTASRNFYPRSPCGERPSIAGRITSNGTFLSTLSLRRATRESTSIQPVFGISIHALLAESDQVNQTCRAKISISIHALLAESDSKSAQNSGALLRI